jgi:putative mycofactocin binding protein MftB
MSALELDLDLPWALHPQVSIRPEPFGALLYHFGTRRLSFLKDHKLLEVVRSLAHCPNARLACEAAGIEEADLEKYRQALGVLRQSSMVIEMTP